MVFRQENFYRREGSMGGFLYIRSLLSGESLILITGFFTPLRYVQNDNMLDVRRGGLLAAKPPASPLFL